MLDNPITGLVTTTNQVAASLVNAFALRLCAGRLWLQADRESQNLPTNASRNPLRRFGDPVPPDEDHGEGVNVYSGNEVRNWELRQTVNFSVP